MVSTLQPPPSSLEVEWCNERSWFMCRDGPTLTGGRHSLTSLSCPLAVLSTSEHTGLELGVTWNSHRTTYHCKLSLIRSLFVFEPPIVCMILSREIIFDKILTITSIYLPNTLFCLEKKKPFHSSFSPYFLLKHQKLMI